MKGMCQHAKKREMINAFGVQCARDHESTCVELHGFHKNIVVSHNIKIMRHKIVRASCVQHKEIYDRGYMIDDCFQSAVKNQQSKMIPEAAELKCAEYRLAQITERFISAGIVPRFRSI